MLAEMVDHVVGVDPDRDRVTAVLLDAKTKAELDEVSFPTTPSGYAALIDWADAESVPEARVWSIEGAGSYGAGLCATLQAAGEWVLEFDHPETRAAKDGAKSDGLDAARAAREVLGRTKFTQPRARGTREGIRALLVARRGAKVARVAAINALKALVVTAPVALREQLRDFTTIGLVRTCGRMRLGDGLDDETAGTKAALRHLARRIEALDVELIAIDRHLKALVTATAPQLLDEYGVGPVTAAQFLVSWSHGGRCRNEGAFARLAGVAPITANSGQTQNRHRLNRGGDRHLNNALHTVVLTRTRDHQPSRDYIARRITEGKTPREARRCLKRYIARHLFRLLEHPPTALDET
jgi:transposase